MSDFYDSQIHGFEQIYSRNIPKLFDEVINFKVKITKEQKIFLPQFREVLRTCYIVGDFNLGSPYVMMIQDLNI